MTARSLVRALYSLAIEAPGLRRPLEAVRTNPRVRAFARRHVGVLLAGRPTWANVDGALRLLAEDPSQPIAFVAPRGDVVAELLYWLPFVRWARERFALDPARLTVVSRGEVAHWYRPCRYLEDDGRAGGVPPEATLFPATPVLALADRYRAGGAAPRPLLKRALHRRLEPPEGDPGLPGGYVVLGLTPSAAFPATETNLDLARRLAARVAAESETVEADPALPVGRQHALVTRASGLVASWSGLALLGVLSGVPTVALVDPAGAVCELDLDLAARIAAALGSSFAVLAPDHLRTLAGALGAGESPAGLRPGRPLE